ncbi:MAG: hypothetical protein E7550_00555 [Ruminococcaceae bacterium]|nr:hypothetical protein [Oscillospiraceae bacterium]
MRKILNKVGTFFTTFFCVIAFVLSGIALILYVPIDYIKYKKSPYYKIERRKYEVFGATGQGFKLYNIIVKNNLPIKYISNPKDEGINGWFVYDKTLIVIAFGCWSYDGNTWVFNVGADDECDEEQADSDFTLDDHIESEISDANQGAGEIICEDAVVLIKSSEIANPNEFLKEAQKDDRFIVYEDDIAAALKKFIDKKSLCR